MNDASEMSAFGHFFSGKRLFFLLLSSPTVLYAAFGLWHYVYGPGGSAVSFFLMAGITALVLLVAVPVTTFVLPQATSPFAALLEKTKAA